MTQSHADDDVWAELVALDNRTGTGVHYHNELLARGRRTGSGPSRTYVRARGFSLHRSASVYTRILVYPVLRIVRHARKQRVAQRVQWIVAWGSSTEGDRRYLLDTSKPQ